jgi:LmbE family N-acetylglucosaminyl deacetylase
MSLGIDLSAFGKVLAFFAHPDDETLAAGATISKMTRQKVNVHVAIAATGIHGRRNVQSKHYRDSALVKLRKDCSSALATLGINASSNIYFGNFSDNEMDKHSLLEVVHWVEEIISNVKPELILTHHHYDTNIDHQYCHNAVVVATRPSVDSHIPVICGEIPSSTGYLRPARWEPNLYIEVEKQDVDRKIEAMQSYVEEARPDPHPRSGEVLRALAKVRGSESGFFFAEAFMVQKMYG